MSHICASVVTGTQALSFPQGVEKRVGNVSVEGLTNGAWVQSSEVFAYFGSFGVASIPIVTAPEMAGSVRSTVLFALSPHMVSDRGGFVLRVDARRTDYESRAGTGRTMLC